MGTYSVSFLSRDDRGRFTRVSEKIPAEDAAEVESFVYHGERNGRWPVEGDIRIRGPIGTAQCDETVIPN